MLRIMPVLLLSLLLPVTLVGQDNPGFTGSPGSPVFLDRDKAEPATLVAAPSAWQHLAQLDPAQRASADLQIDLPPDATPAARELAGQAMAAWQSGAYDVALTSYANLAAIVDMRGVETVLQWHTSTPGPLEKIMAANVQLGTRDSITSIDLVSDASSRHLFAVAAFQGDGSVGSYELYRSTNGGTTWSVVSTNTVASDVSVKIAFVRDRVHVIYRVSGGAELRWRRYDTTGTVVSFPGIGNYVYLAGPGASPTVVEATTFTNNMYQDNRLYYMTILSDHSAHMYWAYADSSYFTHYTSRAGVSKGISGVWANYTGTSTYFASYVDTSGQVCIDSVTSSGWTRKVTVTAGGNHTSLGYYQDTVLCVYESGSLCKYQISYNRGRTWLSGNVDDATTHEIPAISMEKGQGMAIIYRYYTPTREGRFITRQYRGPGPWSSPAVFADLEPFYIPMAITALGDGKWGVLYTTWTTPRRAFFATIQSTLVNVEPANDILPASIALWQNYPNPFNPATTIRFELPFASKVSLKVYNMLGQEVATLWDGEKPAGIHDVKFDGQSLATGVYVYRLQAGQFMTSKKLLLLK